MLNGNVILYRYIQKIADEVLSSYDMNVDFSELRKAKRVLIIKSVRDEKFLDFMNLLYSEKSSCRFVFYCEKSDIPFFRQYDIPERDLVFHNGRISRRDVKNFPEDFIVAMDKVCFCNYSDFKPTYENVESLGIEFMRQNPKVNLYSFNVQKKTLNKYVSAEEHYEGTKLLDSIFKWDALKQESEML